MVPHDDVVRWKARFDSGPRRPGRVGAHGLELLAGCRGYLLNTRRGAVGAGTGGRGNPSDPRA